MRIGIVREYMDKSLVTKADEENSDLINAAIDDLRKLGAEIVDPGAEGLFTPYVREFFPLLTNATDAKRHKDVYPVDETGKPTSDQIATFVDLATDPSKVPAGLTIRDLGQRTRATNRTLREVGETDKSLPGAIPIDFDQAAGITTFLAASNEED